MSRSQLGALPWHFPPTTLFRSSGPRSNTGKPVFRDYSRMVDMFAAGKLAARNIRGRMDGYNPEREIPALSARRTRSATDRTFNFFITWPR